jgi:hypothetical protein
MTLSELIKMLRDIEVNEDASTAQVYIKTPNYDPETTVELGGATYHLDRVMEEAVIVLHEQYAREASNG